MTPMPLMATSPHTNKPLERPAPYIRLALRPLLMAMVAFESVAGPGEAAITKKVKPIVAKDMTSIILSLAYFMKSSSNRYILAERGIYWEAKNLID